MLFTCKVHIFIVENWAQEGGGVDRYVRPLRLHTCGRILIKQ